MSILLVQKGESKVTKNNELLIAFVLNPIQIHRRYSYHMFEIFKYLVCCHLCDLGIALQLGIIFTNYYQRICCSRTVTNRAALKVTLLCA